MYQRTWSCPASSARWPAGKPRVLIEDDSEVAAVSALLDARGPSAGPAFPSGAGAPVLEDHGVDSRPSPRSLDHVALPRPGDRRLSSAPGATPAGGSASHSLFREGGFEVAVCSGPDGSTDCPLVEEGVCALAEGADVVLFGLDVDEPGGRAVLHAHLHRHPDVPVVALRRYAGDDADADDADAGAPDPASIVLPATTSVAGQTRALRRAMWRGHGS